MKDTDGSGRTPHPSSVRMGSCGSNPPIRHPYGMDRRRTDTFSQKKNFFLPPGCLSWTTTCLGEGGVTDMNKEDTNRTNNSWTLVLEHLKILNDIDEVNKRAVDEYEG